MSRPDDCFVDPESLAFRMKARWFRDVLAHPPARRYLWSLYHAGEAYEALHPDGIFVERLPDPLLRRQLARHLTDETRHATVFRALLSEEGAALLPLEPVEDVGWHLLTHVVPDVVERSRRPGSFDEETTVRYMAFLHVLELRSIGDLCALVEAARLAGEPALAARLGTILPDERFHATYTHRAARRLSTGPAQFRTVMEEMVRAERRHMTECLLRITGRFEALGAAPRDGWGRLRWRAMRAAAQIGLGLPLLPVYDRVPGRFLPGEKGEAA